MADPSPSERFETLGRVVLTPTSGRPPDPREETARRRGEKRERVPSGKRPLDIAIPEVYGEAAIESDVIG